MDLRNFLFHSGYPIDKVIGIKSGTYTIANRDNISSTANIAHGLPGKPLGITVFSDNASFTNTYDEGFPVYVEDNAYGITVRTTTTNIQITGWSTHPSAKTIYWRTILLEPAGSTMDVAYTASQADIFQFNTNYNYSKLIKEGSVTTTTTIPYDVGFVPQTLIWMDNGTWIERLTNIINGNKAAELSTTALTLRPGSTGYPGITRLHYRIYGDD